MMVHGEQRGAVLAEDVDVTGEEPVHALPELAAEELYQHGLALCREWDAPLFSALQGVVCDVGQFPRFLLIDDCER